ncbi:D-alanine--D-alanine ligase [Adlercreutzia sp. ZJ473]|uniref:D-alanine--D-alanine ligase family protein n=1 Tax=Adlercreutzia sp. ZJ473 TaxID=2722822 RepID=UPI00155600AC|nr:D-alanine--D-alanine ligase [Adlercreutzia sp. ZJ473]
MSESFEPTQCRVALLSGGTSGEREISLASGKGALNALIEAGFQVIPLDPAVKDDLKALIDGDFDVAFLCLHGRKGEDGAIQGFLEMIDLPYIGSNVWSSALSIDKVKAKMFYEVAGIPAPQSITLKKGESFDVEEIIGTVGDRCVIKPATEGSSLGVFIVEGRQEIESALKEVFSYDTLALVETYVKGTELTVAVIGNDNPRALPIIEIVPKSDSYDFESKYAPGGSEHICPARLSDTVTAEIQELAERAHKALECSGVSRSDFILDEEGTSWILETNTIPGMTGTSLLPDAARAAGMSFPELCTFLVQCALEKD